MHTLKVPESSVLNDGVLGLHEALGPCRVLRSPRVLGPSRAPGLMMM